MGDFKHVIQVPVVVNSNTAQVLVVTEIPLTPSAFRIEQIQKLIEIDDCAAVCDKVIINGRLIKNSKTMVDATEPAPGLGEDADVLTECEFCYLSSSGLERAAFTGSTTSTCW